MRMHLYQGYIPAWLFQNGPVAISFLLVFLVAGAYVIYRPGVTMRKVMVRLLIGGLAARLALTLYFTLGQLVVWSSSELGKLFLPPHQAWSYFFSYVGLRYWLPFAIAILLAGLWYGFLRLIGKRSERYLDVGELELTTILVFAAGWPNALALAPIVGVALVLFSLVRMIVFKRQLTTLGIPFIIGALITLTYGDAIRNLFAS